MQVIVLQEKLAEKDRELQSLKETLQQPNSPMVEDKVDSPPTEKQPKDEATISGDAESWDQIDFQNFVAEQIDVFLLYITFDFLFCNILF